MCPGGNSLHVEISLVFTDPVCSSLSQKYQPFNWRWLAVHMYCCLFTQEDRKGFSLAGQPSSCPGAVSTFKDASHKDYLWASSSGLKPTSRAWATSKHINKCFILQKIMESGNKKEGGIQGRGSIFLCCSPVPHLAFQDDLKSYQCLFVSVNKQYQFPHHFSSTEALRNSNTRHTGHTVNLPLLNFQKHPKQHCSSLPKQHSEHHTCIKEQKPLNLFHRSDPHLVQPVPNLV